jgi:hypothetical protein
LLVVALSFQLMITKEHKKVFNRMNLVAYPVALISALL